MIRFEAVTKHYRKDLPAALNNVDLLIEPGEFIFLIGPSGSGKSTFLSLVLREYKPSNGSITVDGMQLEKLHDRSVPKLRRKIGVVFQDFRLLSNRTVKQNVGFALDVIGVPRKEQQEKIEQILATVGLNDLADRFPHQLSGGEQQRVAIARACVNQPTVLIADEPTGNLDPETSAEIMRTLDQINRFGTTVIVATHDAAIVDGMRRRVIELAKGEVIRDQERGVYGLGDY
ncbi:MAG: cell division ATP-binding protein FtsE [Actinobacteria bacterium]|uniref:Cell division ATP-binding protein FtsE n=1 Tax=freshwater metagenome TaxID=449393 RepID=A0A6J6E145_9ZZZZ|nr:cell division ATP-binding protein FtsE [Actinomycetota bacterium]